MGAMSVLGMATSNKTYSICLRQGGLAVTHETPRALLVEFTFCSHMRRDRSTREVWFPKSQIEIAYHEDSDGETYRDSMTVPAWLVGKEDLWAYTGEG